MFRVRIVSVDHYMNTPFPELDITHSEFRGSSIKQVPIIRIFGTTPEGEKSCVHVHGVFPYICVPYDGSEPHLKLSHQLAASLDKAINIASGYSTSNTQHVFKVVLVSGIPMYGYHRKRHQFLKIYFYKPSVIKQAVNLLQNGAILNRIFQPHEAHVPFILQFFIDFNLYGMSYVDFHHVKFRKTDHTDLVSEIPAELMLPESISAVSLSQFEVDVSASCILNRPSSQGDGQICNPGLTAIWEDENKRRLTTESTPLEIPPLHSQRPACEPTSSEGFYLRRIQEILENASQMGDDSSLSEEPRTRLNVSYAIEEPPNRTALDASFVSLHVSEQSNLRNTQNSPQNVYLEDTVVDEEIARDLNISISQRFSQTVDRSLTLDYEDLELLDALETLADIRPTAVDNDSVLGSQTSRSKTVRCSSNDTLEEQGTSDEEDDKWHDKTLVAEEDDPMKLLDLTMPDIDENLILRSHMNRESGEPQLGPSSISQEDFYIPQVDGVSDIPSKHTQLMKHKLNIPQLDGVNAIPSKPGKKSLGMRGGVSRGSTAKPKKNVVLQDPRYSSRTGELIFKNPRKVTSSVLEAPLPGSSALKPELLTSDPVATTPHAASVHQGNNELFSTLPDPQPPKLDHLNVLDSTYLITNQLETTCVVLDTGSVAEAQTEMVNSDPDFVYYSQSTIQNTIHSDFDTLDDTQYTMQNTLSEALNDTQSTLENTFIDNEALNSSLSDNVEPCSSRVSQNVLENIMLPCYGDGMRLEDEVVRSLQPPVACCSSAAVGCSEVCGEDFGKDHDCECADAFIDMLAKKQEEPVLRGDPSLYPDQLSEKEDLTDFIASEVCKVNSVAQETCPNEQVPDTLSSGKAPTNRKVPAIGLIRRSNRLSSRESSLTLTGHEPMNDHPPVTSPEVADDICDPASNFSPCSCSEIEVSAIPGFTTSMFYDVRESLGNNWSPNSEVTSDSEMCRLECALQNGQMEEILQSGADDEAPAAPNARREELMHYFHETQKSNKDCQGTCSKAKRKSQPQASSGSFCDPVTDDLLLRGRKPLPGRPKMGKCMDTLRLYCGTTYSKSKRGSSCKGSTSKSLKRGQRERRRLKLSITAQMKKKEGTCSQDESSHSGKVYQLRGTANENSLMSIKSLPECWVVIEKLTKENIYEICKIEKLTKKNIDKICKKFKVKIRDKSALGKKSTCSLSFSESPELCDYDQKEDETPLSERLRTRKSAMVGSSDSLLNLEESSATADSNNDEGALALTSHCGGIEVPLASTGMESDLPVEPSIPGKLEEEMQNINTNRLENLQLKDDNSSNSKTVRNRSVSSVSSTEVDKMSKEKYLNNIVDNSSSKSLSNRRISSVSSTELDEVAKEKSSTEAVVISKEKGHKHEEYNTSSKSVRSRRVSTVSSNEVVKISEAKENSPKKSDVKLTCRGTGSGSVTLGENSAVVESNARNGIYHKDKQRSKMLTSNKTASSGSRKSLCSEENREFIRNILPDSQMTEAIRSYKIPKITTLPIVSQPNVPDAILETAHHENLQKKLKNKDTDVDHGAKFAEISARRRSERLSNVTSPNQAQEKILPTMTVPKRKRGNKSESVKNEDSGVDTTGEISSAHSTIYEEMELKEISMRGVKDSKDESSLVISLDTSDIKLYLSDVDDKITSPTQNEVYMPKLNNIKSSNVGAIPCVDGATESSSDSSSGSQSNEQNSTPYSSLKRKISERLNQGSLKSSRKNEDITENTDNPSAMWFAKPYGPWSFWSPLSSPKSHHHSHVFTPPRPVSPENTHGRGLAAVQDCMEEAGPSHIKDLTPVLPGDTPKDLFVQSQSMENISSSMTHVESGSEKDTQIEFSSVAEDICSRKTSQEHSILDMFNEKSLLFSEENSEDELDYSPKNLTVINLNKSPTNISINSSFQLAPQRLSFSERFHASSSKNICAESIESDGDSSFSPSEERSLNAFNLSSESSEFQCGQRFSNKSSGESCTSKKTAVVGPSYLKTLKKPPSRREIVDSLASFNIPDVVNQEPFCSNYCDVKGKMEVGGNVLDLRSNSCIHLDEFHSCVHGLRGLRQQQKSLFQHIWGLSQPVGDFNQLVANHLDQSGTTIAPVRKPPTVREVTLWAKARQIILKKNNICAEERSLNMARRTPKFLLEDPDSDSKVSVNVACDSPTLGVGKSENIVQASTPDSNTKKSSGNDIQSPLFTPILQLKSQIPSKMMTHVKSGRYLRKLSSCSSPLTIVSEKDEDDMGVQILGIEMEVRPTALNSTQVDGHDDSSLRRLLLDSQFCEDVASPMIRHVLDASACQIKGGSSSPGFKMALENLQSAKTNKEHQYITLFALEVHVCTCGTLKPDPERDPIRGVFFSIMNDVPKDHKLPCEVTGIVAVNLGSSSTPPLNRCGVEGIIQYSTDEKSLLEDVIHLVRQWDPDILAGFEVEMLSWGYLVQRASVLNVNMVQELSRIPNIKETRHQEDFEDNNGPSSLKITGRIVLDVWRLFRSEVALQSYSFESLMYHILHQRVSYHSFESLSRWWENPTHLYRWITVRYYQQRVVGVLRLLDQLDIIGRTSELARLFGIQFFEVLSRGSQFRVESMMLRLAKPLNYIPVSPSIQQRAHMRAPECLPLIMEPESRFYSDPVIVLDFQSLYPSMIIAYNYCFSTCLGRVEHLGKSSHFEFGCSELCISNSLLSQLRNNITVSPSGIAFVKKAVRQGVLPRMLEEILEARLAVKQSMKQHKSDHTLQRVLHARQLGLKLIANVTYGYTAANFSGRMPCIEIGDSVVSKGRETLERAISLVHSNNEWKARVVYGDTDSLFVLVPGRSRQEAFRIGAEIANAVTQANPSPVKLKLEKVYQPSILQTKKRYVGFMYESPDQKEPVYEAKGIETVRRDGCPAVAKILEKSLRILFETCDVSSIKSYVSRQFSKIITGQASIQDLIFAREYRGKENYRPGACVPALELTKRWLRHDRRAEPRMGERVPYVVVNGHPGSALIHLVRHPSELLSDPSLRYNAVYYITRAIIPPLSRCLSLIGVDVSVWYTELPRKSHVHLPTSDLSGLKKTISQYFTTMECVCCGDLTHSGVCERCRSNPQLLITSLMNKIHSWEKTHLSITKICQSCVGRSEPLDCFSLDCPITFRRHQASQTNKQSLFVGKILNEYGVASNFS